MAAEDHRRAGLQILGEPAAGGEGDRRLEPSEPSACRGPAGGLRVSLDVLAA